METNFCNVKKKVVGRLEARRRFAPYHSVSVSVVPICIVVVLDFLWLMSRQIIHDVFIIIYSFSTLHANSVWSFNGAQKVNVRVAGVILTFWFVLSTLTEAWELTGSSVSFGLHLFCRKHFLIWHNNGRSYSWRLECIWWENTQEKLT